MAVAPTLYVATLVPTAARPARDRAFYVPYKSSEWELVGYNTRSAIRGTPSPPRALLASQETQKKGHHPVSFFCVPREARTLDPLIKSQLLYQLS